ncbi:N-acylglucosamine-6-phosphate 2-epimerase [Paenibacillus jilunlii]|uniref:Putative N-acetylmannosamine-6-phosphate 2-epimerase n=1 Tax=Paenibacillus jilunlii TaxID=682956 RepID=A0A1G9SAW1_9BACL|nr:N-acetylmannosamine-6-phosphate 2-epimerase [Paenibacillus jilunlii]KWX75350.1 N-acetylmannosamine-6-phosphate 2-epimerase [Paenibacillus jilunlii]SDM32467.1 N-acylglucosamine-6-phosphate 2-epimerase [Paenibacillus jilunlii]
MGTLNTIIQKLHHGLIVSCQALPGEPLYGAEMMARMAAAAEEGGAVGIRANGAADVRAIKSAVSLPVIGIIKRDYPGSAVYITPTLREIEELLEAGADMIAFDATGQKRPEGCTLEQIVSFLSRNGTASMADISILEEAIHAEALGVSCVSTTLSGYTPYSLQQEGPNFELLQKAVERLSVPVIAEGRMIEPDQVRKAMDLGAYAAVVGSAITRPQLITGRFAAAIRRVEMNNGNDRPD